jgi:multiple sugar transport system permease protein
MPDTSHIALSYRATQRSIERRRRETAASAALYAALLVLATVSVIPFIWVICATFKTQQDLFAYAFLPWDGLDRLTLANYEKLFTLRPFGRWVLNSIILSCGQTVLVVTLSSLGGFALAKYRFRGKKALMLVMLGTMLLPAQVLLPGSYELMYHLDWLNTYRAILIPGAVSVFGMFLYRQAMVGVPDELLQAGRVDGCSELRLWWDVALPIVRPMTGAFTLLTFLGSWNNYLWPQIVLMDQRLYTLPIGLANMIGLPEFETQYGVLMAGTLLSILPVVILFFIMQRDFIAGLASGAVKG